jgi:predicted nucleic acid-binding protein
VKVAVLDSYALLAFLFGERGHQRVLDLLQRMAAASQALLVAAPNWAEVRYVSQRKVGAARWVEAREKLLGLPLDIIPADQTLAEIAGEIKATRSMSLADCFAAALARQRRAELYTGDPEFRQVEKDISIIWL